MTACEAWAVTPDGREWICDFNADHEGRHLSHEYMDPDDGRANQPGEFSWSDDEEDSTIRGRQ